MPTSDPPPPPKPAPETSRSRLTYAVACGAVVVIAYLGWKRSKIDTEAPPPAPTPSANASALPAVSIGAMPWATPRMKREQLRAKILTAILDDASVPLEPTTPPKEDEPEGDGGEHEHRNLTLGLPGVPAVNFPTEYMAEIYKTQLGPLTRKCFEAAREKKPDAGGAVTVRYVVVGAPGVGGIVEDATVDESTLDDDFEDCVHESVLTLSFDRAPDQGGWKEAGFVMEFGKDGG